MGAALVASVFANWAHLPDRAFRALVYMALICLDSDAQPTYWAGRGALAKALGCADPESVAAQRVVERAVNELRKAGAIELYRRPARGHQAEYRLSRQPPSPTAERGAFDPSGDGTPTAERGAFDPSGDGTPTAERGAFDPSGDGTPTAERGEHPPLSGATPTAERCNAHRSAVARGETRNTRNTEEYRSPKVTTSPARRLAEDHGCDSGWLMEDDNGNPTPCLVCKPHLIDQSLAADRGVSR